jgi:hypothetical protein
MKRVVALLGFLSLFFAAAGSRHQAFGPVKFGMTESECSTLLAQLGARKKLGFDASDVRTHFLSSSTKRTSRFAGQENATLVRIGYNANPKLVGITASSQVDAYDKLKQPWEVLRETADCKFKRVGAPAELPGVEEIKGSPTGVVTDTWEFDGITVKLSVVFIDAAKSRLRSATGEIYEATLTAIEPEGAAAK